MRRRATAVTAAAYLRGPALSVPWQPRPAPSRGGQRGSRFFVARRGAGTDPVSSCDAAELGIRGFSLVFSSPLPPLAPARPPPALRAGPAAGRGSQARLAAGRAAGEEEEEPPAGRAPSAGPGAEEGSGISQRCLEGEVAGEGAASRPVVCRALSPAPALAPVSCEEVAPGVRPPPGPWWDRPLPWSGRPRSGA